MMGCLYTCIMYLHFCSLLDLNKDGYLNLKCSRFAIFKIQEEDKRPWCQITHLSAEPLLVRIEWVYNDRPTTTKNWQIWAEKFGRVFGSGGRKINTALLSVSIVSRSETFQPSWHVRISPACHTQFANDSFIIHPDWKHSILLSKGFSL